jgi:hypothetical protein
MGRECLSGSGAAHDHCCCECTLGYCLPNQGELGIILYHLRLAPAIQVAAVKGKASLVEVADI